jgi:hypothetical protein
MQVVLSKEACELARLYPPGTVANYDDDGKFHSDSGPAITTPDGSEYWYQHGVLHRDGGPALINNDKTSWWRKRSKEYWVNGKWHRLDGPAVTYYNYENKADEYWYKEGLLHSTISPTRKYYHKMKEFGNYDRPSGWFSEWFFEGKKHRNNGPAVESEDFPDCKEYWFHGKLVLRISDHLGRYIPQNLSLVQQEFLIQLRPDVIRRIYKLNPKLRVKYQHELELGNVDL